MPVSSYTHVLLDPIYTMFGVTITFVLTNDDIIELVGIDKSGGVEVSTGAIDVPTVQPACIVRMADLIELGYAPENLIDAILDLNGVSWRVVSYFPKPSPRGEADGELYIVLNEAPTT